MRHRFRPFEAKSFHSARKLQEKAGTRASLEVMHFERPQGHLAIRIPSPDRARCQLNGDSESKLFDTREWHGGHPVLPGCIANSGREGTSCARHPARVA